jgi:hypothetical protein
VVPPITGAKQWDSYGGAVYHNARLGSWTIDGSFDTAGECRVERANNVQKGEELKKHPDTVKPGMMAALVADSYLKSICISSDDPRLKPK